MKPTQWIDMPPFWLAGAVGLAWGQTRFFPLDLGLNIPQVDILGRAMIAIGFVSILLCAWEFRRKRTTPIPHQVPSALITKGPFRWSRNPIYTGDVVVLAGFSFLWRAEIGVVLVPLFILILQKRFILPEEARLEAAFGGEFLDYCRRTRRWL